MSAVGRYVRAQDFVWLLLFTALGISSPQGDALSLSLLAALGMAQVLERRMGPVASVSLKLALCYLLIGVSGGVSSSFYITLLLPVISAATSFGGIGTTIVTALACAEFGSFLLFLDWSNEYIPEDQERELLLRMLLFPVIAFLTHQLAAENRAEAKKLQATARDLAAANESLNEAQAEVRRADRVAALGQLTAGLAHELRNPLGTMKTSAEMLTRSVGQENEVAREMARFITEEVDRTSSLITRFLEFARPHPLRREPVQVKELLDRAVTRFEREHSGSEVAIFKNYSPDVPSAPVDGELMERVILNLLANAAQASTPGAAVTLKTRRSLLAGKEAVEIAVIDRGSGIETKNLESIFNPFFTTKSGGVGLGLPLSAHIVQEHGGAITVDSTVGEGSVFRVFLPVD